LVSENLDEVIKVESVSEPAQCPAECQPRRECFRAIRPSDRSTSDLTGRVRKAEREFAELIHRFSGPKSPGTELGDAHIFRFGFPGALDGFHVA